MTTVVALLSAAKGYVSGQKIAVELGISRAAVHKQISALRERGFGILSRKNTGYWLVSRPDTVTPEDLREHLADRGDITNILHFDLIDSTQTAAKKCADEGAPEGTLVIAEQQSASYGRLKRHWSSPRGGLWFSLVLRPDMPPEAVPPFTGIAALALARVLEQEFGLKPQIKWPNDIILNGRKLAGILMEMSAEMGTVHWLVPGIGMNVNNEVPPELSGAAISLKEAVGRHIDRSLLLARLIEELFGLYRDFRKRGFAAQVHAYCARSSVLGRKIRVDSGEAVLSGTAEKIDSKGYLWLRTADGKTHKLIGGDIIV